MKRNEVVKTQTKWTDADVLALVNESGIQPRSSKRGSMNVCDFCGREERTRPLIVDIDTSSNMPDGLVYNYKGMFCDECFEKVLNNLVNTCVCLELSEE